MTFLHSTGVICESRPHTLGPHRLLANRNVDDIIVSPWILTVATSLGQGSWNTYIEKGTVSESCRVIPPGRYVSPTVCALFPSSTFDFGSSRPVVPDLHWRRRADKPSLGSSPEDHRRQ
jgi:hypothetical protein